MELTLTAALVLFASIVGTITGFGISTIMIPVLALFYPPEIALLFVGIIHFFGDCWKIILFRKGFNLKLITLFGLTGIITSFLGARLIFNIPQQTLSKTLGIFLIAYVSFIFFKPGFKLKQTNITALTGGACSGFLAGFFGIGGAIRSSFLSAFDLPKSAYIATTGAIALIIDITRLTTYFSQSTRLPSKLTISLIILIPLSFIGAKIAKKIINKIPQKYFRPLITAALLLISIKLLITK